MGTIHDEVRDNHLADNPQELDIIKPFLASFNISWARIRRAYNTELSIYILQPLPHIADAFGFGQELLLAYSRYPALEARTFQAAEQFLNDDPCRGRVEKLTYLLVSEMPDAADWLAQYVATHQEARVIVAFAAESLRQNAADSWLVRNALLTQLHGRDLFDYRLPLRSDTYFFGRDAIVLKYNNAVQKGENAGLFGLRKTGKTSILFKLQRLVNAEGRAQIVYVDCKLPAVRQLRWNELVETLAHDIADAMGVAFEAPADKRLISRAFAKLVSSLSTRVVLVFDEIEYISFVAKLDPHWHEDFVPFWQTIWSVQSAHRQLSIVVSGVNASVVETAQVAGVQNPLFGIVSPFYLKGFDYQEMRTMVRTLGKRMGLHFSEDGYRYIHNRYGGHPLLTRIACSRLHTMLLEQRVSRPVKLDKARLEKEEAAREADVLFYCEHVVSELREFYPDEYEALEYLATGRTVDYLEVAEEQAYTRHLNEYGLVSQSEAGVPRVSIPVVNKHVGLQHKRAEGRKTILDIVASSRRRTWLSSRLTSILADLRQLELALEQQNLPSIYGPNSIPESHRVDSLSVVSTEEDFTAFINVMQRAFVEGCTAFGKMLGQPKYFDSIVRNNYPALYHALQRVRLYRHDAMHLKLFPNVSKQLAEFLRADTEGRSPAELPDYWFVLQQCVVDGLLSAINVEVARAQ